MTIREYQSYIGLEYLFSGVRRMNFIDIELLLIKLGVTATPIKRKY